MSFLAKAPRLPWLWLLVALAGLPALPASAQAIRVSEIEIRGEQNINEQAIRTVITTKVGDEASPERLERDRLAIEGLGWFRLVTLATQRQENTVRVIFVVTEFPKVTQYEITGSSLFTNEQLLAVTKTRQGEVFNQVNFQQDLAAILKLYADKGYQIRPTFNTDQPDFIDRGILRIEIQELKVGSVKIKWPLREIKDKEGNVIRTVEQHKTRQYVVLRELSQKPGALYNVQQLQKDFRALNNLGFFETINPVVEVAENLTVSITWELSERRTGQVSVGAGYSPRQQLIGRAELSDQNFRGKAQGVSISGEIGTFGGDGAPSIELSFHEPWLTKDKTSLSVSIYNKLVYRFSRDLVDIRDVDRYFERRLGGQISFGRPFRWPVSIGLRAEQINTEDLPKKVDFPRQDGTIIAGNISRVWNSRDYPQNPTTGNYLRLTSELGHASLDEQSDESFTTSIFSKFIVDARKYIPLKRRKATKEPEREQEAQKMPVLALRFLAGGVAGDIPFFEQFFLGGAETLRGYLEDRFWGNYMFLASVEYRRPIMNRIVGVLFVDVGDAFGSRSAFQFQNKGLRTEFGQHSGLSPQASVGIGLRVATPIGPIRLDFGYGREGGRTHFSIGHAF
jgi:outer membrane protein insertion porin family